MKIFWFLSIALLLSGCATTHSGRVATMGGGSLYYEERGKGEPLLLLHGHSLDGHMWDEQWKPLSRHFRLIRLDFRGYGRSSEQREDLQFCHVDDVVTLMDSLHIQRAHVVGLSMGAFVAGDMLAMYPERLLTCTLASGGIRSSKGPSEPMDSAESAKRDSEIAVLKAKGVDQMKSEWIEQLMSSGGSHRERMRKPLTQMIQAWSAWQPFHLKQRGQVDVPVLCIRGANELKGKHSRPAELKYTKNGHFVVIEDCGHMLNMERPNEFNRSILEFINSQKY